MLPYIPWAHGLNADEPEDVPDVDEEAEDAAEAHELLQEEELDKRDRAAAKLYEDRLFEELGVHQEKRTFTDAFGTWDVSRVEKTARRLLTPDVPGPKVGRKRRRTKTADGSGADRKRQRVKTTEFVQDSDDEGEDLDKEDGGTDEDENAGSGTKDEGEEGEGDENAGASEGAEEGEEGEGSEQDDE
ncbi:uncharacterized protein PHACADRAFT_260116 [Phanerochaete carnosa HHB-10118-sp]|uniref:Uncharacterized protein n=1 Tax=Phanerochaete carnosa (strain HHB-10118-sp) TaxID=650164 RepID=K5WT85_PHACS|nr:uncharacterized protein PHACADRAFT_260116 [Phanerochaete carnosa HHB-10118-sp]EKM53647.1 hypothetical protein PHACADRAFT_260116 [Phanerochaete carnosa HHB-10118-sp]